MKYIDSEKLIAWIKRLRNGALERQKNLEEIGQETVLDKMIAFNLNKVLSFITSLQQEQPKSKIVKVRCVFPFDETWEKDKIYTCKVWHHGDLNHDFWDVYYDYEKDSKYVQFPTIELLNEEFAIIQEESHVKQDQPELQGYDKALLEVKSKVDELYEEASIGLNEYDAGLYNGIAETCMKLRGFIKARLDSDEQPELDLDKEFNDFLDNEEGMPRMWHPDEQIEWGKDIARHFYERGQSTQYQKDRAEFAKLKAKEWQKGFDEGLNARKK